MNATEVVIVGAGPSGLMLALDLIKQGVDCVILEKRSSIASNLTRAFSVHARTLEVLHTRGLAGPIRNKGSAVRSIPLLWGMHARFDHVASIFPEMLVVPQFEIENVLLEQYSALGGAIIYEAEVLGLSQTAGSVAVRFSRHGSEHRLEAAYVVGADGHHSSVRTALNVDFVGSCVLPSVIISDAKISSPSSEPLTLVANDKGFVFIAPFGDGYHRVLSWDPSLTADDDETHDFERLSAMVTNILGEDVGVHDPRWLSRFSSHECVAAEYRRGGVFLIGDAAHVHSPAGGLGMNLGLQDAINLGWKLGAVLRRGAPESLLESYEQEMQPLGHRAVKDSGQLIREATGRRGISASVKDTVLAGVAKVAPLKNAVERGLGGSISGTSSTMRGSARRTAGFDRHVGTFAFELMANDAALDGLRRHKHVLVLPKNSSARSNSEPFGVDAECVELDHEFRGNEPRLIRPDGYIDAWKP